MNSSSTFVLLTGSGGNSDDAVIRAVLALLLKPEAFKKLFVKSYDIIYYSILIGRWSFFTYLSAGRYYDNIMVPELLGNLSCQASSNTTAKDNNNHHFVLF